jgi:hypothetical protein
MTRTRMLTACCAVLLMAAVVHAASIKENTYEWVAGKDHGGWKGMTNYPTGYVIVGTLFFEAGNTNIFITGFNDFSQHQWTITHPADQHGFTQLDTFWKAFTNIGPPANPNGYFIAASGTRNGSKEYYTLQTSKTGERTLERFGPLPEGITFGGASQAVDGGYIATGGTNAGVIAVVKFTKDGDFQWHKVLSNQGFGWTIQPAAGGGYVIGSTNRRATRIDADGNELGSAVVDLPASPDTSAYTYSEFEEIVPLQNGSGFIMTGSIFSNSTSGVYTARFDWADTVAWSKVNDTADTSQPGTPVAWANSAIELSNPTTRVREILFTWRTGPVSQGGTMFYERMNPTNGAQLQKASLLNTVPVQEAFTVRQPFVDRIIIAGTRGGYPAVYSYTTDELPTPTATATATPTPTPTATP